MTVDRLSALLDAIAARSSDLHGQDVLLTWERSLDDLHQLLDVAAALRLMRERNLSTRCFDSGLAVSLFRDNSTRTRFSYASAANLLGLSVQDLDEGSSQIAHGETTRETAVMVSFLSDAVGIRDDMYLGAGNAYMREVAAALDEAHADGVLPVRPPVVNLQCDLDHPTQSLADLRHLIDEYGSLEALRERKLVMSWAYSPSYGKPLSVPQGVIGLMTRLGMNVVLAHPPGYDLVPDVLDTARTQAQASGGTFNVTDQMADAFEGADIVYPKSWAPLSVMKQRTELLRAGNRDGLENLERTCLDANREYADWTCDERLMDRTRDAHYLHCLPADITGVSCDRGEVTAEVFDQHRVPLYRQAGCKPFIIAAMILCSRFEAPGQLLRQLVAEAAPRVVDPS